MRHIIFALALLLGAQSARAIETGTANQVLRYPSSAPAGTRPTYGTVNLASSAAVVGTLPYSFGGTGQASTFNQYGACYATTTTALATTSAGSQYQPLVANSASAPTFQALSLAQSAATTGTLLTSRGGLGLDISAIATGGTLYASGSNAMAILAAGTNGQHLEQVSGVPAWTTQEKQNYFINSGFDYWQRGTSTTIANASSSYQADRWLVVNALGTNGVATYSRQTAGANSAASYGLKAQITTAPTAAQANGLSVAYSFDNLATLRLYNRTASVTTQIKSFGNVNSVTLALAYVTAEGKVTPATGTTISSANCTVNTSTFTECKLENVALGTSVTTSGSYGFYVKINTVSSGNTYDLNNGFQLETPSLNAGAVAIPWQRMYAAPALELAEALRFFWRYATISTPLPGQANFYFDSTTAVKGVIIFPVTMRTTPTLTIGGIANWSIDRATSSAAAASASSTSQTNASGTRVSLTSGTASTAGFPTLVGFDGTGNASFQADAEL